VLYCRPFPLIAGVASAFKGKYCVSKKSRIYNYKQKLKADVSNICTENMRHSDKIHCIMRKLSMVNLIKIEVLHMHTGYLVDMINKS
jgi:hypothetical protein